MTYTGHGYTWSSLLAVPYNTPDQKWCHSGENPCCTEEDVCVCPCETCDCRYAYTPE